MWLQQAAKNSNVKVGGIAGPLAWRYHKRGPVPKGIKRVIILAIKLLQGQHNMTSGSIFSFHLFSHLLICYLVYSNSSLITFHFATHFLKGTNGENLEGQGGIS